MFVSNAPVNNNPSLSDTGPRITSILFDWAGSGSLLRSTQCLWAGCAEAEETCEESTSAKLCAQWFILNVHSRTIFFRGQLVVEGQWFFCGTTHIWQKIRRSRKCPLSVKHVYKTILWFDFRLTFSLRDGRRAWLHLHEVNELCCRDFSIVLAASCFS